MNSVILLILITFESCIYSKYFLVESPVSRMTYNDSKEGQRYQFFRNANKKSTSQKLQSSKGLEPDETSLTSKGLSGNNNVLLI